MIFIILIFITIAPSSSHCFDSHIQQNVSLPHYNSAFPTLPRSPVIPNSDLTFHIHKWSILTKEPFLPFYFFSPHLNIPLSHYLLFRHHLLFSPSLSCSNSGDSLCDRAAFSTMNTGEKSAIEAMLGLSRPNNYATHSAYPSSQPSPPEITCGSSVSPSLSPVQHKRLPPTPQTSDIGRPKAMRLSQLLTDDSPPDKSPFPQQPPPPPPQPPQPQHIQLHHSLHLPLSTSAPRSTTMPSTEPVTPPFSPPVLPPLSHVTGLAIRQQQVADNSAPVPPSSTWFPTQLPSTSKQAVQGRNTKRSKTTESLKKIVKRPYKKYYSNPTPSSHCHVCARTSKAVKFAICARISEGLCRKVTCYKCFAKFGWDWEAAVNSKTWICVHCRGVCPEGRSQCYIYSRVNSKRESKRKKGAKALAKGQGVGVIGSQTSSQGVGAIVPNAAPVASGLPSIRRMGGQQGVTSFSGGNGLHSFIRPM